MAVVKERKTNKQSPKNNNVTKTSKKKKAASKIYREKQTRADILHTIAEELEMTKTQVENVFKSFKKIVGMHLCKKGSGEVNVPHLGVKIKRRKKKASKARSMVSPLTGQVVDIPAKKARDVVTVKALKSLKDTVDDI